MELEGKDLSVAAKTLKEERKIPRTLDRSESPLSTDRHKTEVSACWSMPIHPRQTVIPGWTSYKIPKPFNLVPFHNSLQIGEDSIQLCPKSMEKIIARLELCSLCFSLQRLKSHGFSSHLQSS